MSIISTKDEVDIINSVFWVITLLVVFIGRRFKTPVGPIFWADENSQAGVPKRRSINTARWVITQKKQN
jgi:hypothetical protein